MKKYQMTQAILGTVCAVALSGQIVKAQGKAGPGAVQGLEEKQSAGGAP